MTAPRLALALPIATLVVALAGCTVDGDGGGTIPAIRVVEDASLPTTVDELPDMGADGFRDLLAELDGTPTVVNVWATWCRSCAREMPRLAAAAERYRDEIQFLGVDIGDARDPARRFLRELAITYPNVFDVEGEIRTELGGVGQPVTAFIDADGAITVISGEVGASALDDELARIAG